MANYVRSILFLILISASSAYVDADAAAASAAVFKEIQAVIANKVKYPNYLAVLTILQQQMPNLKKMDLSGFVGSTILVPNNFAAASFPTKDAQNSTLLTLTAGYHTCDKKYTFQQILDGSFGTCHSPGFLSHRTIYIQRGGFNALQFAPQNNSNIFQLANAQAFYEGTNFNALGVDRILKPPGAVW